MTSEGAASRPARGTLRYVGQALVPLVTLLLVVVAVEATPLRHQGGDTLPGRLGALTLECRSTHHLDLAEPVLARVTGEGRIPYYAVRTRNGDHLVSTFGPGPAWLGQVLGAAPERGAVVDDELLRRRARRSASLALGISGALFTLGLLARSAPLVALVGGLLTALGFAGVATLGQGLWQQTAALPALTLLLAFYAWTRRFPWLALGAAFVGALGALLRPADAPLLLGIALATAVEAFRELPDIRSRQLVFVSGSLTAAAFGALPVVLYALREHGTLLPLAQLTTNQRMASSVLSLSPERVLYGGFGLLVSPARGVLFFAPILLLVPLWARHARLFALALALEFLLIASFFKWWGGLGFGPRLLSLSVWTAAFAALLVDTSAWTKRLSYGALAWGALVGVLGALNYDPRSWEIPKNPDRHPEALFSLTDSPWQHLLAAPEPTFELGPELPGLLGYCRTGSPHALETLRLGRSVASADGQAR